MQVPWVQNNPRSSEKEVFKASHSALQSHHSSSLTMRFTNILSIATAAVAVSATPVVQNTVVDKRTKSVDTIVSGVESLLKTVIDDVETILVAAGADATTVLSGLGVTVSVTAKRDEAVEEKRGLVAVVSGVENLVNDVLKDAVVLAGDVGFDVAGILASLL